MLMCLDLPSTRAFTADSCAFLQPGQLRGWCCAGGWFSIMMSVIYASIMLLWFWGTSKKKAFYARKNIKLTNFLALMDAGDGKGRDHQNSMTIAQQNIALRASSTKLKRVRGALLACCILCGAALAAINLRVPETGPSGLQGQCRANACCVDPSSLS